MKKTSLFLTLLFYLSYLQGQEITGYEYWFDQNTGDKVAVSTSNGTISLTLDVSPLNEGIHFYNFRAKDSKGRWSAPLTQYFLHTASNPANNQLVKYEYWIDKGFDSRQMVTTTNGVINLDLDMSALRKGIHYINFRAQDTKGQWSAPLTQYFYCPGAVNPNNKIVAYEYWCNEADSVKTTVNIDPVNPLELKEQPLQVDIRPVATPDSFRLAPDIYGNAEIFYFAQNTFNIRFKDLNGNWSVPAISQFIDGRGMEVVADTLHSGQPVKKTKPATDEIHFYKLNALTGDSLIWKTDQPCTIQVFDPFGVEIYKAVDNESLAYGGKRAKRDGVYYVLLHSVNTWASQITLEYQHIPKYAILGYTPKRAGNSGNIWVSLKGNGFTQTTQITLFNEQTTLTCDSVIYGDLSATNALFSMEGLLAGSSFNIKVDFTDTIVVINDAIAIEDALPGILGFQVLGPSTVLRGSTNLYTIKVTNTGNTTISYPFISIVINSEDKNITVSTDIYSIYEKKLCEVLDLNPNDFAFPTIENNLPNGMMVTKFGIFIAPIFAPYESKELHIQIQSLGSFNISTWQNDYTVKDFEEKISSMIDIGKIDIQRNVRSTGKSIEDIVCEDEYVDCLVDWFGETLNGMNPIENTRKVLDAAVGAIGPVWMGAVMAAEALWGPNAPMSHPSIGNFMSWGGGIIMSGIASVAFGFAGTAIVTQVGLSALATGVGLAIANGFYLAHNSFKGYNFCKNGYEDCMPPNEPFNVTPVNSYDPNDKLGYRSPSGSTYFKEGITNMTYVINFENDPEKATAAAQDVYITDMLDMSVFDINSFRAGFVRVGGKFKQAPYDVQNHTWDIDMRPEMNLITRVKLSLDQSTGMVQWHFSSVDPVTDKPVTDALAGFLPPNDPSGNGQGSVSFTIDLKKGLADDIEISNQADIVFDYNEPIVTPAWVNRKDVVPPVSRMKQSSEAIGNTALMQWEGTDVGSGVWYYDIYVAENRGPYSLWKNQTTGTSAGFDGKAGFTYHFFSIATDSVGHVEAMKSTAEASVSFAESVTGITLDATTLNMGVGDERQLIATVLPESASNQPVRWSSSDPGVATVSDGWVTAVKVGATTITATVGSKTVTCAVTVSEKTPTGVEDREAPLATIYPNPNDGRFTLVFAVEGDYRVSIANISGKLLSTDSVTGLTRQIDISSYPHGTYLITIENGKRKMTVKVVKNR